MPTATGCRTSPAKYPLTSGMIHAKRGRTTSADAALHTDDGGGNPVGLGRGLAAVTKSCPDQGFSADNEAAIFLGRIGWTIHDYFTKQNDDLSAPPPAT